MSSRFNLNSQPRALVPFSLAQQTQSPSIGSPSRTLSPSECQIPALRRLDFSLFSLFSHKDAKSTPLFSITCTLFFTLCKRVKRYLHSFQPLPRLLQEYPQGIPPRSKTERVSPGQSFSVSVPDPASAGQGFGALVSGRGSPASVPSHRSPVHRGGVGSDPSLYL
jgi:hypothetical protein